MVNILDEIKYAYQRVVRGYDDRVFWGFDSYFLQVVPALKEFCEQELKGTATLELNPERYKIFTHTLELIKEYENMTDEDWWKVDNQINRLLGFVGNNIGYFWD